MTVKNARFQLRLEDDLARQLEDIAAEDDRSVSYIVREACLRYVSGRQSARSSVPADDPIPLTRKGTSPLGVKN